MPNQILRQRARRRVLDKVAERQKERQAREGRLARAAVDVLTALAERDARVAELERAAGAGIADMLHEGLTLSEAAAWCADLDRKEVGRLHRLAADTTSLTDQTAVS